MQEYPPPDKVNYSFADLIWDTWCFVSVAGIWPRFIEPQLLTTTKITMPLPKLPSELDGLKILQFSDLHLHPRTSTGFLKRLSKKIMTLSPDLIVFTGDFICYSHLSDAGRLQAFLNSLKAPLGCYAVLGNHDYAQPISINKEGEYDIVQNQGALILEGLSRIFRSTKLACRYTDRAKSINFHNDLMSLLAKSPFKVLHNTTTTIPVGTSGINISGLGEYTLGKIDAASAFAEYNKRFPGIVLLHNPDACKQIMDYPGDVVLCGHTHGGQVNLPWLWRKFTLLEDVELKSGLVKRSNKWIYINRGVGSVLPFRWFAPPELLLITLEPDHR